MRHQLRLNLLNGFILSILKVSGYVAISVVYYFKMRENIKMTTGPLLSSLTAFNILGFNLCISLANGISSAKYFKKLLHRV